MKITRETIATILHDAGDRLHALARRVDPPEYGVRIVWDDDKVAQLREDARHLSGDDALSAEANIGGIDSGEYIAVGMVAIERDHVGTVRETDTPSSLWGIVTDASAAGTCWPPLGGHDATQVWDLDQLSGYLRTVAGDLIAEARP